MFPLEREREIRNVLQTENAIRRVDGSERAECGLDLAGVVFGSGFR